MAIAESGLIAVHKCNKIPYMEQTSFDQRIGGQLRAFRTARNWSLDELSRQSGVSRATLSRLENAEVSPTANVLGKLCGAFGITLSRLMYLAEEEFSPLVSADTQQVWIDPETGFRRRAVSPPSASLAGEALACELEPDTLIEYDRSPRQGLEHHLYLLEGRLRITLDDARYDLHPGDTLRYRLFGKSAFATDADVGAKYLLFMV